MSTVGRKEGVKDPFLKPKTKTLRKNKKQIVKIPVEVNKKIKEELLEKYGLKSYQALFDYLVVSGVVFLRPEVIKIVDDNIQEYIERDKKAKLSRFGKIEAPEFPEYCTPKTFQMYLKDFKTFSDFAIERNYAKQWIMEILFSEFSKENEDLIALISKAQKLNVRKRKKQVARLLDDEWITCFSPEESKEMLAQFTENYESGNLDSLIQEEIYKLNVRKRERESEEEEEAQFQKKMENLRSARHKRAGHLMTPRSEENG